MRALQEPQILSGIQVGTTLTEMKEWAPDVLDFLVAIAVPKLKGIVGRQIIPLCTAYGILMSVRALRHPKSKCCVGAL